MTVEHRFTVTYDEPLLREAVKTFMLRRLREAPGVVVALVLTVLALAWLVWLGDRSWPLGLFAGVLVVLVAGYVAVWRAHLSASLGRLARMKVPQATVVFRDADLTVTSDAGAATMPWNTITDIWELPRSWLVFTAPSQFFTLPIDGVPPEALSFAHSRTGRA